MSIMNDKIIMVVEDSDDDFFFIERAFGKVKCKNPLLRMKSGDEALSYLYPEHDAANVLPGVILLDLNMPGTNGREVLLKLKSDSNLKKIPVIVMTTSDDERDVDACYANGANSYVVKPVDFNGFIKAIELLNDYWFELSILSQPKPS